MAHSYDSHTTFYRVHPPPPPTVNFLSSRQKAQLRRSANKLTKVLGAAPQVLDDGYGSVQVSRPMPLSATKKKQPSLSVSVEPGSGKHRHTKSMEARVDPDLYPLSSSLRPIKPPTRKPVPVTCTSTSHYQLRRERSSSVTGSDVYNNSDGRAEALVDALSALHQRRMRPQSGMTTREHTTPTASRPDSLATRDSICDSLYEPAFVIPSTTKVRRDKMARVCKLLGEEVPVELVFPSNTPPYDHAAPSPNKNELGDDWSVIDIRRNSLVSPHDPPSYAESKADKLLPPLPNHTPDSATLPPKPKLTIDTSASQPRWTSYRTTGRSLEPIAELSPRTSSSSRSSLASGASFSSTTTSSSYRFTSSGCSDPVLSPISPVQALNAAEADTVAVASPTQDLHENYGFSGRREFSIYLPFQRRARITAGYAPVLGSDEPQEFEVVKTMVDLRG